MLRPATLAKNFNGGLIPAPTKNTSSDSNSRAPESKTTGSQLAKEAAGEDRIVHSGFSSRESIADTSTWVQCGVDAETAEYFGVGFFSRQRFDERAHIVIPSKTRGELVAYAGRAIDGSEPKYKFPGRRSHPGPFS